MQTTPSVGPKGASARAIAHHYDSGNEFFRLWLDRDLHYSCAMFAGDDDLELAQRRKVAYHIEQAGLAGKQRGLDIGCGWGGVLRTLAERHGVAHVTGLTLSDAQAIHVRQQGVPGVEVRTEGWEEHQPDEPYDGIVCIGALEHFVRRGLSSAEKVRIYRDFFKKCRRLMVSRGKLSLQTIAYGSLRAEQIAPFITESIFPESDLPRFSEIIEAADRVLEVENVRNDRLDYARTCREWCARLVARKDAAVSLVGLAKAEAYVRYLRMSAAGFEQGGLVLLRLTLKSY